MRWMTYLAGLLLTASAAAQPYDFTASVVSGIAPLQVEFEGTSINPPQSWQWDFGDGATASGKSVVHTFTGVGSYTVTLKVSTILGPVNIVKDDFITVVPQTVFPAFAWNPSSGANPLVVDFTDASTGDVPDVWSWNFGDGNTSSEQNPTHVFDTPGTYSVTLTTFFETQVAAVTEVDIVTVSPANLVPDFNASTTTGENPLFVEFTDTSQGPVPTAYLWDFGDGGASTEQSPSYTYVIPGTWTVSLTLSFGGQVEVVEKRDLITALPATFMPDFVATQTMAVVPVDVAFTDTSTGTPAETWLWDFGDGETSTEQNPEHVYVSIGVFDVSLTTTVGSEQSTVLKKAFITSEPAPIVVDFEPSRVRGVPPFAVDFEDLSEGADFTSWAWNFGDGSFSAEQNPTHVYAHPGVFSLTLTVGTDAQTESIVAAGLVDVLEPPMCSELVKLTDPAGSIANFFGARFALSDSRVVALRPVQGSGFVLDVETGEVISTLELRNTTPLVNASVAMDGDRVLVGVGERESVFIFDANSGAELGVIESPSAFLVEDFGASVVLEGGLAFVGAPIPQEEALYVFNIDQPSMPRLVSRLEVDGLTLLGGDIAAAGDYVAIGGQSNEMSDFPDKVFLFDVSELSAPSLVAELAAEGDDSTAFGLDIAMSDEHLVVGDRNEGPFGRVTVYDVVTGAELVQIEPTSESLGSSFGAAVDVDRGRVLVGSSTGVSGGVPSGTVSAFDANTGALLARYAPSDGEPFDEFGAVVAVERDLIIVGAPGDDDLGGSAGAVYRLEPVAADWSTVAAGFAGPELRGFGAPVTGCDVALELTQAPSEQSGFLIVGAKRLLQPLQGGVLVPSPDAVFPIATDVDGLVILNGAIPPGVPLGTTFVFQHWAFDPSSPSGVVPSNGLVGTSSN